MLKYRWGIISQDSVIDQATNNLSILNVLEELRVQVPIEAMDALRRGEVILAPIKHHLTTEWLNESDDLVGYTLRVTIIAPDLKEIGNILQEFNAPKGSKRVRVIQKMESLPLSVPGRYLLKLAVKENHNSSFRHIDEVPVDISYASEL